MNCITKAIFLKPKTIKISQLQAFKVLKGKAGDYDGSNEYIDLCLTQKYSDYKLKINTHHTDTHVTIKQHVNNYTIDSYWSFIIWYMDKNSPPKRSAFDYYRDKDF